MHQNYVCKGSICAILSLVYCLHVAASDWLKQNLFRQTVCSDGTDLQYTAISVTHTYKLSCLALCGEAESCYSVLFRDLSEEFGECILVSSLSGCPPSDVMVFEKQIPRTCADIQRMYGAQSDGEYCLSVDGIGATGAQIYCHDMGTDTPSEYLTLPSGESENYSQTYKPECTHGSAFYSRIRLNLMEMEINSWDETHATVTTVTSDAYPPLDCDSYPLFGLAFSCSQSYGGPNGQFNIDLTGTGFYIPDSVDWVGVGASPTMFGSLVRTPQTAYAQCSGRCGGCVPQDSNRPSYTYFSTDHTDTVMPVAYNKNLDPSPCQIETI